MLITSFYNILEPSNNRQRNEEIPELGLNSGSISKLPNPDNGEEMLQNNEDEFINFYNSPKHIWVHTDMRSKCKFVNIALPIFSGSQDIRFNITEDGMNISVHYNWAEEFCSPEKLFYHEIGKNGVTKDHPKIHALATKLLDNGISEVSIPKGMTTIKLPMKVQRENGSWTKNALKTQKGTQIILLTFKCYQESQIVRDADTTLKFD